GGGWEWRCLSGGVSGNKKSRSSERLFLLRLRASLLDLAFLEDDVLARHRVVLLQLELLGLGARVLLRHVVEAGIGAADELDEDGVGLGHGRRLAAEIPKLARSIAIAALVSRTGRRAAWGQAAREAGAAGRSARPGGRKWARPTSGHVA